jgi:hypothetical protein
MTVEARLSAALASYDEMADSPDLFARVNRSIEADLEHRRRVRIAAASSVAAIGAVAVSGWLVAERPGGVVLVPRWWAETVGALAMVALVAAVGRMLRRIGGPFVSSCFARDEDTARHFLGLIDIAHRLVSAGLVLLTVSLRGLGGSRRLTAELDGLVDRLGLLVMLTGGLHAAMFTILPFIGLVFGVTRRRTWRLREGVSVADEPDDVALADRVVRAAAIIALVAAAAGALLVVGVLIGDSGS